MTSPSFAEATAAAPLRLDASTVHEAVRGIGAFDPALGAARRGAAGHRTRPGASTLDRLGLRGGSEG